MKHLVLVTTSFPDGTSGSEAAGSFVEDLAKQLSLHIMVTVLAPGKKTSIETLENLTIKRFAVPRLPLSLLKAHIPFHWRAIIKTIFSGKAALEEICEQKTVDHIFSLWVLPSGYWAYRIKKKKGIPYSVWALGSDIWSLGKMPAIRNVLKTTITDSYRSFADGYKLANNVRSISNRDCDFLPSSRALPLPEPKTLRSKPPFHLAYIGRWHPNKGVDILLDSLKMLDNNQWVLIKEIMICGGGPMEELVHRKCNALINQGRPITLRGYVDKEDAAKILHQADYLIIPSRIESIPVIFSDAMQCMCPVISTPVGDMPKLINEHNVGFLSSEPSSEALLHVIQKALTTKPNTFTDSLIKAQPEFNIQTTAKTLISKLGL